MAAERRHYDLHTHSTASDGTLSPAELVHYAASAGVTDLALTDHDSTAGLEEAEAAAQKAEIQLIPGAELSVSWQNRPLHIVGLGIDPAYPPLAAGLARVTEFRHRRAERIAERLADHGIDGALNGAHQFSMGNIIGRTHFARFLVETGHAKDVQQVFKRFLVKGKPGFVPSEWVPLEQGVRWIIQSGGIAIIAHPARYPLSRTKLLELISDFKAFGGQAMEVVSGSHSRDETRRMAEVAHLTGLLASAGSDYHGPDKPWIDLGKLPPLPSVCTPVWEAKGYSAFGDRTLFGS